MLNNQSFIRYYRLLSDNFLFFPMAERVLLISIEESTERSDKVNQEVKDLTEKAQATEREKTLSIKSES